MKLHLAILGLVIGCASSQELSPERARDTNYWLQELSDDAHPDEAERAVVIRRYLDLAPPETKAELGKLTDFLTPCTQRLRLAGTLHRLERFDSAIKEYRRLSTDGCEISTAQIARRIGLASIEAKPDEFPSDAVRLNKYLNEILDLESSVQSRDRDEIAYEIGVVQYMVSKPEAARLHKLVDRAITQMGSGNMTDIEGVFRTIVVLANTGGSALGDGELLTKAVSCNSLFHSRFGYSVF
jgi:hypothetical protein